MYRLMTALVMLFTSLAGLAAEPLVLDVDETVRRGTEYNLNLQAAQLNLANKALAADTAFNVFYPEVSLNSVLSRSNTPESGQVTVPVPVSEFPSGSGLYDYVVVQDYEIDPNVLVFSVSASLPISLAMFDGIRAVREDYAGGVISYHAAQKKLERDLRKNFYSLIVLREQIALMEASVSTMQERYRQTSVDYRNGRVPEIALLNSQVAFENMGPKLTELRQSYDYALTLLKLNLGIDPDTEIALEGDIDISGYRDPREIAYSVDANPDLQLQASSRRIAEIQRDAEFHAAFLPSFLLQASTSPFLIDPYDGENWDDMFSSDWADQWTDGGSISLTMTYPVSNLLPASPARVSIEKLENSIAILELQEQSLRETIYADTRNILDQLDSSRSNITALELNVRTNVRNVTLVREAYQGGSRTLLDVESAEDELRQARINLLNEKFRYLGFLLDYQYALDLTEGEMRK